MNATCVFQTSANSCHWRVPGSATRIDRGLSGESSRYQGHQRHHAGAEAELEDALANAFGGQQLRAQSVERDEHRREGQEQRPADDEAVDERPDLTIREVHPLPHLRALTRTGFGPMVQRKT